MGGDLDDIRTILKSREENRAVKVEGLASLPGKYFRKEYLVWLNVHGQGRGVDSITLNH